MATGSAGTANGGTAAGTGNVAGANERAGDFMALGGPLRVPVPNVYKGEMENWEEWSWSFKVYVQLFDPDVADWFEYVEGLSEAQPFTDQHLHARLPHWTSLLSRLHLTLTKAELSTSRD